MKISLDWLNTYLEPAVAADAVDDLLTGHGFPVEATVEHHDGPAAGDTMFDVEVTSNRGDCLSHVGVAREIAAGNGAALSPPDTELPAPGGEPIEALTAVEVREAEACPVYTARVITGVRVGPSPPWLVARLEAVGLRSVNNVVDVTNFVLMELGQPLHAFDLDQLSGGRVVVRPASPGERFTAIDGSRHELSAGTLVIADAEKPQAVAGIMGGADSEVGEATTRVLLESAIFEPLGVRRTGRALKLASDSSFRFERGVDPAGVEAASRRAAALIVEVAGGTLAPGVIRVGSEVPGPATLRLRAERCRALLGVELSADEQAAYLSTLGMSTAVEGDTVLATVPTYRLDLTREVDLIEEVARLHGMDAIPMKPKLEMVVRPPQDPVKARRAVSEVMVAHGYHEAVTFSFVRPNRATRFLPAGAEPLRLEGDHKKDEPMLRPSVLPSLLQCRKLNQDAGNHGVKLFETASTWSIRDGQTVERVRLACLTDAEDAGAALRGLRGLFDELAEALGGAATRERLRVEPVDAGAESSVIYAAAGRVLLDGRDLGGFGVLGSATQKAFGLQTPVAAAELDLPAWLSLYPPQRSVGALPRFPGIERDLSVIVDEAVAWSQIEAAVAAAEPAMLEGLAFMGIYRGKPIADGQKSVSLRLRFRDPAGTLRHDQVDPQVAGVLGSLRDRVAATLRG
ncbi:MAG: phenylalanine--tRNA ligase subunit beta [Planctomycetota bacterium]